MMSRNTIDERIEQARQVIHNALDDAELAAALARFGYGPDKLAQGEALYQSVLDEHQAQHERYSAKLAATSALHTAREQLKRLFQQDFILARIVFAENGHASQALSLAERQTRPFSSWLAQVRCFYTTLANQEAYQAQMAEVGFDAEELAARQAALAAVEEAKLEQGQALELSKQATAARNQSLKELEGWVRNLSRVTKIARTRTEPV